MCYCYSKNLYNQFDSQKEWVIRGTNKVIRNDRCLTGAYNLQNSQYKEFFQKTLESRSIMLPETIHEISMFEIIDNPLLFLKYFHQNIPIIIKDAINHWPALEKWDTHYLGENLESPITVDLTPDGFADSIKGEYFVQPYQVQKTIKQFYKYEQQQNLVAYIQKQCNNFNDEFQSLESDIDPSFSQFFSSLFRCQPDAQNFWMGDKRSVSSLHKDPYDNLYSVIKGQKHFTLIPPECYPFLKENKYIDSQWYYDNSLIPNNTIKPWISLNPDLIEDQFQCSYKYHVILQEGDVLYLPSLWYHQVSQYSTDYTIAVNYWWDMQYGSQGHCLFDLIRNMAQSE